MLLSADTALPCKHWAWALQRRVNAKAMSENAMRKMYCNTQRKLLIHIARGLGMNVAAAQAFADGYTDTAIDAMLRSNEDGASFEEHLEQLYEEYLECCAELKDFWARRAKAYINGSQLDRQRIAHTSFLCRQWDELEQMSVSGFRLPGFSLSHCNLLMQGCCQSLPCVHAQLPKLHPHQAGPLCFKHT